MSQLEKKAKAQALKDIAKDIELQITIQNNSSLKDDFNSQF